MAETELGSAFWNSLLVGMKFSIKHSWIKFVRKAKNKPNYGMRNMDGPLEEVIGTKLELSGPLIDCYLKEIGKGIVSKLTRSKETVSSHSQYFYTSLLLQGDTPGIKRP